MRTVFETARLVAREMTPGDLDFVASLLADPEVMRHYPRCQTRDEAAGWIARAGEDYASHGFGRWLILDRAAGRPVGMVGLLAPRHPDTGEPEAVWMIARADWRRGLALEAASTTLDRAFGPLAIPRVVALIRPVNAASAGVAARLGMRPGRKVVRLSLEHDVYAIDREDWRLKGRGNWPTRRTDRA